MKIRLLLLLVVVVVSCKKKSGINTVKTNGELIVKIDDSKVPLADDNRLKITLDILVHEDDLLDVFYTSDSIDEPFSDKKRINKKIKGSENYQTVIFPFPEDVMPYSFRIDLGDNVLKKETNIEIKTIKLKLNNKAIIINKEILDYFFIANDYLKKTDLGYLRMVDDNEFDPYLLASPVLLAKMKIEF